jgi:hypothetical protein
MDFPTIKKSSNFLNHCSGFSPHPNISNEMKNVAEIQSESANNLPFSLFHKQPRKKAAKKCNFLKIVY